MQEVDGCNPNYLAKWHNRIILSIPFTWEWPVLKPNVCKVSALCKRSVWQEDPSLIFHHYKRRRICAFREHYGRKWDNVSHKLCETQMWTRKSINKSPTVRLWEAALRFEQRGAHRLTICNTYYLIHWQQSLWMWRSPRVVAIWYNVKIKQDHLRATYKNIKHWLRVRKRFIKTWNKRKTEHHLENRQQNIIKWCNIQ